MLNYLGEESTPKQKNNFATDAQIFTDGWFICVNLCICGEIHIKNKSEKIFCG
jgi:hypothetical protein